MNPGVYGIERQTFPLPSGLLGRPVPVPATYPMTPFDPRLLSGLTLWLDGSDASTMRQNSNGTGVVELGSPVGFWADKSGRAHHVTQAVNNNRPTWTASQLNGLPALAFDGSNDTLSRTGYTAENSLAGLTRFAIWSSNQTSVVSRVFSGGSDFSFYLSAGSAPAIRSFASQNNGVGWGTNLLSVPTGIHASVFFGPTTSLRMFYNNQDQGAYGAGGAIPTQTGSGTPDLSIGSNVSVNFYVRGYIAEYIVYNRTLSVGEMTSVHEYLRVKWGFT